jgi:hypothetical protein
MPLVLQGATSGQATVQATDAATVTLTLPATSGTLSVGGTTPSYTSVTTNQLTIGTTQLGAGDASTMKNHLINGAMQVWQRGTSQTFTNSIVYGSVDRWAFIQGGGSASILQTQSTSVPSGFQYSVKQQRTASSTTTGTVYSIQEIESVNCYDMAGQTATLSFWAKCGANFSASGSTLTSLVYQGTGTDQGTTSWISGTWTSPTSNTQSNTLTTTWQRFSQTVTIGASTSEILVSLQWNPTGTAGADDSVFFTGVQLEVGSSATGYEYVNYETSLANCQRYYEVLVYDTNGQAAMSAPFSSVADSRFQWLFKVQKRANPSYSVVSGSWGGNTPSAYFSVSHIQFVTNGTYFFLTGSGGSTAIGASAEL